MSEYKAQLLAVEAKLAKDPENADLLSLKEDLIELIELSSGLDGDDQEEMEMEPAKGSVNTRGEERDPFLSHSNVKPSGSKTKDSHQTSGRLSPESASSSSNNLVDKNSRRPLSEAELLAKKKEKNRKKKAKLRERIKEQLDIAESEKQSWQSFANKKGLKGVSKKSIFASPCSVTGKVGVGTNGIADAPSATKGPMAATLIKRKH